MKNKENPFHVWNHLSSDELDRYLELQESLKTVDDPVEYEMVLSVYESLYDVAKDRYNANITMARI